MTTPDPVCGMNVRALLLSMPAELLDDLDGWLDGEVIMRAGEPDGELVAALAFDVRAARAERASDKV